jgi:molybdopterin-guanine dinucleotide biosynthesis protein A
VTRAVAGILVGGAGTRMGGVAKGLMRTAAGGTLIERWRATLREHGVRVVLVGDRSEYVGLGIELLADRPAGIGPLGGLIALLRDAQRTPVLALACDMPFVSSAIVDRLLTVSPGAPVVAPRRDGRWEPLCARYDPALVLPAAEALVASKDHSLQTLLHNVRAVELPLTLDEAGQLHDWDTREDQRS